MASTRIFVILAFLGIIGWGILTFIQWRFGLGDFAKGPQEVVARRDEQTHLLAGGRAGLVYLGRAGKDKVRVLLRCQAGKKELEITSEPQKTHCGVTVALTELKGSDGFEANFLVTW